jgi:hypothetical protein
MGLLILVLRWAYSSKKDTLLSARPRTGTPDEYGLLVSVAALRPARARLAGRRAARPRDAGQLNLQDI